MAIQVRAANASDIGWLLGQLYAFEKFAGYGRSLIEDENHARAGLLDLINKHLVLVAEKDSEHPLGFIAAYKAPHPFNPRIRVLSECFWWVAEDARRSRAGALLLKEFIAYGRRYADWIVMSLESISPVKTGSMERLGFKLKESSYLMEV